MRRLAGLLVLAGLLTAAAPAAAVVRSAPDPSPQVDASVQAIAVSGDRTYIGGDFDRAGVPSGGGADVGRADGAPNYAFGKPNAQVLAVVADGAGGWFIGGAFTKIGTVTRNRIAHLLPGGAVDPAFDANADEQVTELALSGTTLFAGGNFSTVNGGTVRHSLAAFDATTGTVTSFAPDIAPLSVSAIAVAGNTLYAGGTFTTVNGNVARNRLAAFDTATGAVRSFDPNVDAAVSALAVSGTTLYAGGAFTTVNGATVRHRVAAFDTATGLTTTFDPDVDDVVTSLALSGATVYAGGVFTHVNGNVARNRLAAFAAGSGAVVTTFNPDVADQVRSLAVAGTTVYAGGRFDTVNGTLARHGIAAFDATDGTAQATFDPNPNGDTEAIAVAGTRVYIGGTFQFVGADTIHRGLAAILPDGTIDPAFNPIVDDVYALTLSGGKVYAGGYFHAAGAGVPRGGLAAFDSATGALDPSFHPAVGGIDFSGVSALVVSGSTLYAGGQFLTIDGATTRHHLAAFDLTTGAVDAQFNPNAGARVNALVLSGTTLYAGGEFQTVNGSTPRNFLAALNLTSGTADPTFNPNINGTVNALTAAGGRVYAGGQFSAVNGAVARSRLAAFDPATGTVVGGFDPGADAIVRALTVSGTTLYAGGDFAVVNGSTVRHRLAAFDTATGLADPSFNPDLPSGVVDALLATGPRLEVGGSFFSVGQVAQRSFARFSEPVAPAVASGAATAVSASGATLAGTVDPHRLATAYVFEYGTTTAFGSITTPDSAGSGDGATPVTATLASLAPHTTYLYRLVATNSAGTTFGAVMSFTTGGTPVAPVSVTGAAGAIGATSAVLSGDLDPRGLPTAFTFEYGTTTAFGSISAIDNAGSTSGSRSVSLPISGLEPATTYLYRLVTTNAGGTTTGAVHSFTTAPAALGLRARS